MGGEPNFLTTMVVVFVGLMGYFLPLLIAFVRDHRNLPALAALNVFLGWTLIGWVAALVWSLYRERGRP